MYRRGQNLFLSKMLRIGMTDRDIVKRISILARVGSFNGPYQSGHDKPVWEWQVVARPNSKFQHKRFEFIARKMLPYLGIRRRKQVLSTLKFLQKGFKN